MRIWISQSLAFMDIKIGPDCSSQFEEHRRLQLSTCSPQRELELVFMQNYDGFLNTDLKVNGIDTNLNCIRIIQQRSEGEMGKINSGKQ